MSVQSHPYEADDLGDVGQMHSVLPHPLCLSKFRRRYLRGEADLSPIPDQVAAAPEPQRDST